MYFAVVVPLNALMAKFKKPEDVPATAKSDDIVLLEQIRDLLAGGAETSATPVRPHPTK